MKRGLTLVAALFLGSEGVAWADEPPITVEPPLPDLPSKPPPTEPSPVKIEMPRPPPNAAPSAPPPPPPTSAPPPVEAPKVDRGSFVELGVGPTYLGVIQSKRTFSEVGAMFHVGARIPIREHYGIGFRFAYGMTGWNRAENVAHQGYKVGKWTTQAYKDTWEWAGEGDSDSRLPRVVAAIFGSMLLVFPYVVAGLFYVAAPVAASSYAEVDATFNWEPGDDPKYGPYVKAGLAFAGYVHPDTDHIFGGLGPHLAFGYRANNVTLGVVGTFLPNGLHGRERADEHVFIGSFVVSLVH